MSEPTTLRGKIVKGVATAVNTAYGPTAAVVANRWFRAVRRGPVLPTNLYPSLTVTDAGQRRSTGSDTDDESTWEQSLAITVTLHLAAEWAKVAAAELWTDRVERVKALLNRNLAVGPGMIRMDYQDDDPAEVVFFSGQSAAVWQIVFEAEYFDDGVYDAVEE